MYLQSLNGEWQFRRVGEDEWRPAVVPGGVHTDLLALGLIPDPFVGDNERRVQWVAENDWEYRRYFAVESDDQDRVFLVFDGLDTLAEVWLNGRLVGCGENMFRQYRWEVGSLLREGENELRVLFRSPVKYITARQEERPLRGVTQAIPGGPYMRKAPCQFGWDWGPMLPPTGIWKEVRLEGRSIARLEEVHLQQQHDSGEVTLLIKARVERWGDGDLRVAVRITDPTGETTEAEGVVEEDAAALRVPIAKPQLWWPNGYGAQPLYKVEVSLVTGSRVLDRRSYQVGLRTLELRREPDRWGESFTFVVNGVPVFAKGANWIPADSFPTRIDDEHLEHLIRSAAEANFNMLRVWGGGFYEEERFYDLCDRYGILVWQDMVFSCSIYPLHEDGFLDNVRQEIVQNVRRLRHRASLALWCGNNEMEWGWVEWGWDTPQDADLKEAYDHFFHHLLPQICAEEDPDHAYWPSSPSSNTPFRDPNAQERGDTHYWDVWHRRMPFTAYRGQYPRFMSEFGFQSLAPLPTIRTYAGEKDLNMTSYIMEYHQRSTNGNGLIVSQMTQNYRLPKDFESLVYLSMVLQAEGIRYGVEHWRRNMERVSGTLYWQLNDCWPVASWSSIDYYGRWKALHYVARRFYAPVLLSIEDAPPLMGIYVVNDLTAPWKGVVRWSLEGLDGTVLTGGEERVDAAPLQATHVRTLDFADRVSDDNRREVVFVAELWKEDERVALQVATFAPTKHLSLVNPRLKVETIGDGKWLRVRVEAASLARFVELSLNGADVVFDDNYFDLPAGRAVTVSCRLPAGWDPERARAELRVRSLYDSFA